jgi:hypothetical protein
MSTSVITERIAESEVGCVFVIHTNKRASGKSARYFRPNSLS